MDKQEEGAPSCLQTKASKHLTNFSSPTLSKNSLSVARVLKVSLRIFENIGLGSLELNSIHTEIQFQAKIRERRGRERLT